MALTREAVQRVLDERVAPLVRADGGEIELVEVTEEGIVRVRLGRACSGCPGIQFTVGSLVRRELADGLEGFQSVELAVAGQVGTERERRGEGEGGGKGKPNSRG